MPVPPVVPEALSVPMANPMDLPEILLVGILLAAVSRVNERRRTSADVDGDRFFVGQIRRTVIGDANLESVRAELRRRGLVQARQVTWHRTARDVSEVYARLLGQAADGTMLEQLPADRQRIAP